MNALLLRTVSAFSVCALIAGCNGGAKTLSPVEAIAGVQSFAGAGGGQLAPAQFEGWVNQFEPIVDAVADGSLVPTVPQAATATLTGFVGADTGANTSVLGNLTINADFAGRTFTGATSDFAVYDDSGSTLVVTESLTGNLAVSNGQFAVNSGVMDMTGDLDGVLTSATSGATTVNATMTGIVADYGPRTFALGGVTGTMTNGGSTTALGAGAFFAGN